MKNKKEIDLLYKHFTNAFEYAKNDEFCKDYANEKIIHSLQVVGAGNYILKHEPTFDNQNEEYIRSARCAYILHDIGRFSEIMAIYDDKQKNQNTKYDHSVIGAEILQKMPEYNDPRIVLSVKHHGHMIEVFYEDETYQSIKDEKLKKEIEEIIFLTRDADKIANLYMVITQFEKYKHAWSPNQDKNFIKGKINPVCLECFKKQILIPHADKKSLADVLLATLSWIFDVNYKTSFVFIKQRGVIEGFANLIKKYNDQTDVIDEIAMIAKSFIDKKIDNL